MWGWLEARRLGRLFSRLRLMAVVFTGGWILLLGVLLCPERVQATNEPSGPLAPGWELAGAILLSLVLAQLLLFGRAQARTRRLEQSLRDLNTAAQRALQGDWQALQQLRRHPETAELALSIGQMSEKMRGLVQDLEDRMAQHAADLREVIAQYSRTNQDLERANATKDRIFSIIAHDLKAPFNGLKGYSGILYDTLESLPPDQLRDMIEKISVSSEEAHGLLENLLHWAMMQSGSLRANWTHCNLRDIVLEIVDLMRINAKVKNIQLEIQVSPDLWIVADRMMVATVLRNLIANALKFTHPGRGKVSMRAYEENEQVVMLLADNGIGMPPEAVQNIRRRDTLQSERGTADERGTGLGLQLVHEFILLNQAQLDIESRVGEGSRFRIVWRKGRGLPRASHLARADRLQILLIDDAEDNHDLVQIYLKDFAWRLHFALSGEEGLTLFREHRFDLVLMDLSMPGMGGVEAIRQLRAFELEQQREPVVVIAFTSSLLQSDIDAAIVAGCDAYLVKPIKRQNLIHVLQRYARLPLHQES